MRGVSISKKLPTRRVVSLQARVGHAVTVKWINSQRFESFDAHRKTWEVMSATSRMQGADGSKWACGERVSAADSSRLRLQIPFCRVIGLL